MTISDRLTRGFIAGFLAGIPMNIISYILYPLGLTELRFVDWTSIILLGHKAAPTLLNQGIALAGHLTFTGLLGVIFAYFIQLVSSKNYYFKGWLFSVTVWFTSYVFSILFKTFKTITFTAATPTANFLNASLFGFILAAILKWLDNKAENLSN